MYLINGKEIRIYADREIILDSSLFTSKKMGHFNVKIDEHHLPGIRVVKLT